jgi:cytosine/adenosine deaminase-related metal-dependent hydrolase
MLITNGIIIRWGETSEVLEGKALRLQGGLIDSIADEEVLRSAYPEEEISPCRGAAGYGWQYLCAYPFLWSLFPRMAIPGEPPADFPAILKSLWWKLDKALDEDAVWYSALVCLVDAIKYGTTTLFDHHASPNCIDGSLDIIAEAVSRAGLRASLCYEVTDRDGEERASAGIRETRALSKSAPPARTVR